MPLFRPLPVLATALLAAVISLVACGGSEGSVAADAPPVSPPTWQWDLPAGFAPPVVPADNPMNAAKVELGRHLFYEARLSGNGTQSCASCHAPERAFADSRAVARGSTGQSHPRNSPGLVNVAYQLTLDWANPGRRTLEQQMHAPLFGTQPVEMGVNDGNREQVLERLRRDADYPARFAAAFLGEAAPLHWDNVIKAIAAFERTLIAAGSRHDQAQAGLITLTPAEQRGLQLFFSDRAQCAACHGGPNFSGQFASLNGSIGEPTFHNIGLYNLDGQGAYPAPNRGLFEFSGRSEDMGHFRAPSLRNVALTEPYLHDGSVATLEAVLDIHADGGRLMGNGPYAGDGRRNPFKDPLIDQIRLDAEGKADLLAFLRTLSDPSIAIEARFADPFAK
jgi:cytochrome c peroxidase